MIDVKLPDMRISSLFFRLRNWRGRRFQVAEKLQIPEQSGIGMSSNFKRGNLPDLRRMYPLQL